MSNVNPFPVASEVLVEVPEATMITLIEEPEPLTLTEIYNQVVENGELILTIDPTEERSLRTGLAGVKAKQNAKLKEAGLQIDTATLGYTVTPNKEKAGLIDVHIILSKKQAITVYSMKRPDDSI